LKYLIGSDATLKTPPKTQNLEYFFSATKNAPKIWRQLAGAKPTDKT